MKELIMNLKTQIHTNEFISDEDNAPGESSIGVNIYIEALGAMPNEKEKIRALLDSFYKDLRSALKTIVH
jgi:hypothetical protein